jgi:hypothetical protein
VSDRPLTEQEKDEICMACVNVRNSGRFAIVHGVRRRP